MAGAEPERELVRRISPFALPATAIAFGLGAVFGGVDSGWSASIAVAVVYLNFLANALSIAWAASISPTLVSIVAIGGYVVRLTVYTVALVALNQVTWFSPLAFVLALMPATIALLIYETRALSGRVQADLWNFEGARRP